jgi:hypothetical protein
LYLWNVKALAQELKEDRVTEKEKLKYFVFAILTGTGHISLPADSTGWIFEGLNIGIVIASLFWCFRANQQGDNKDFIFRFICLSVPICIRLVLISGVISIVPFIYFVAYLKIQLIFVLTMLISSLILIVTYFAWIRKYIIYVSKVDKSSDVEA